MFEFFIISIGSILGSLLRWKIDNIYFVNILGCFIFGFMNNLKISKNFKLFFCFSFCGSLTTFSGWIFELLNVFKRGLYLLFFLKFTLSLAIGYIFLYFGFSISNKIKKSKSKTKFIK